MYLQFEERRSSGRTLREKGLLFEFDDERYFLFLSEDPQSTLNFPCKAPAKRSQHANVTCRNIVGRNMLRAFATVWRCVGCCRLKFDQFQTWANNTQHVATHRNTVARRTQHVAPNNVAICCVGMLRSVLKTTTRIMFSLTNWRQFFMRLSCYWSWISSSHCLSSCGSADYLWWRNSSSITEQTH